MSTYCSYHFLRYHQKTKLFFLKYYTSVTHLFQVQVRKKHPVDVLFLIYFIAAIFVAFFRCMVSVFIFWGVGVTKKGAVHFMVNRQIIMNNFNNLDTISLYYSDVAKW